MDTVELPTTLVSPVLPISRIPLAGWLSSCVATRPGPLRFTFPAVRASTPPSVSSRVVSSQQVKSLGIYSPCSPFTTPASTQLYPSYPSNTRAFSCTPPLHHLEANSLSHNPIHTPSHTGKMVKAGGAAPASVRPALCLQANHRSRRWCFWRYRPGESAGIQPSFRR